MKIKLAFILSLFMAKVGTCQEITSAEEVKGKEITYKRISEPGYDGYSAFSNKENRLYRTKQILHPVGHHYPDERNLKYDEKKVFEILANTFSFERLEELQRKERNENSLYIIMYFFPDGILKEVTFDIHNDSSLDVRELEKIEQCLKREIHGWYNEDTPLVRKLQEYNYILRGRIFRFEDLIAFKKYPGWFEADRRKRK